MFVLVPGVVFRPQAYDYLQTVLDVNINVSCFVLVLNWDMYWHQ